MTQEKILEFTRKITQANATQMVTILYEITLEYLDDARKALAVKDHAAYEQAVNKAQNCIGELMRSLNRDYVITDNFQQLYIFSKRELVHAAIHRDEQNIINVVSIFTKLRDCYRQLEKYNTSKAVVAGAQTVYAGLTYGRRDLNESVSDPYTNRGYTA